MAGTFAPGILGPSAAALRALSARINEFLAVCFNGSLSDEDWSIVGILSRTYSVGVSFSLQRGS